MTYTIIIALFLIAFALREWAITREREDWRSERQELLDRIQAPQTVLSRDVEAPTGDQTISWDDDEKYWQAVRGELNVGR